MLNLQVITQRLSRTFATQSICHASHAIERWRAPVAGLITVLSIVAAVSLCGCDNATKKPEANPVVPAPVSDVPLRIRIVGTVNSPEMIQRRWLSGSEQSIEIQAQNVDEFLAGESCDADVVLFPARLIGELVARDWIAKLPKLEGAETSGAELEDLGELGEPRTFPPAWLSQCSYGGVTYALPLGCSLANFVSSEAFAAPLRSGENDRDPVVSLQALLDKLPSAAQAEEPQVLPAAAIDRSALVDRFLALAFAVTSRRPQYGILLDLETMQPRLTEPEFEQAAQWLVRLSTQSADADLATAGSHSSAWTWATSHELAGLTLAATNQLTEDAAKSAAGVMIDLVDLQPLNTGSGMLAAIAVNCRQSHQSNRFLKWLVERETGAVLSPLIVGVDSPTPVNVESLAWRVQQSNARLLLNDQLPQEPRIPGAHVLRMKLADELVALLQGSKTAKQSLVDAQNAWQLVIDPQRDALKLHYQQSLGLKELKSSP